MPSFYGDIEVLQRSRIRVSFEADRKPTKAQMLKILRDGDFEDITDEENLFWCEVRSVEDLKEVDGEEE